MREIEIERLIERERPCVIVKREVGLSASGGEDVLLETSKHFCNIANANSSTRWRLEVVVAGKGKIDRVLKTQPFVVRE